MKINWKTKLLLLILLNVIGPRLSLASDSTRLEDVAKQPYWLRLLHYQEGFLSPGKSQADGKEFFLSTRGDVDPVAELKANLEAFESPKSVQAGSLAMHPQCLFPERFRFVQHVLDLKIKPVECYELDEWKKLTRPQSISLVYAAPTLGHIASLFGHTFLKFNRGGSALLDVGVSFEAKVVRPDPLSYVWRGLTGGYPGYFLQQPYYQKIKSYALMESRDLWEFELSLSAEQIEQVLNHMWELGQTYFDYYFLDENCSRHLLSLLSVANLEWNWRLGWAVMPLETVRVVAETAGAIQRVHYRPSKEQTLRLALKQMSTAERERFALLKDQPEQLKDSEAVTVLDAVIEWQSRQGEVAPQLLKVRSQHVLAALPTPQVPPAPNEGHRPRLFGLNYLGQSGDDELGINYKLFSHDLLDRREGYVPHSQLTLLSLEVRAPLTKTSNESKHSDKGVSVSELTLVDVKNMAPWDELQKRWSWQVHVGASRETVLFSNSHLQYLARAGLGLSQLLLSERLLLFAFLNAQAEYSRGFIDAWQREWLFGPSLELGATLDLANHWRLLLSAEAIWYVSDEFSSKRLWSNRLGEDHSGVDPSAYGFEQSLAWTLSRVEWRLSGRALVVGGEWSSQLKMLVGWRY